MESQSATGEELTMPYVQSLSIRQSAETSAIRSLVAFAAAKAGGPQETAPLGHNQTQPAPLVHENKTSECRNTSM